jgi:cytoskeletal protein CcmA (bactofilin family)
MSLWQKPEADRPASQFATTPPSMSAAPAAQRENRMDKLVNIGQSVEIKGELTGNEDLTIDGKIQGKIILRDHNLTIGSNGRISAEIEAKTVVVLGEVIGNISADDKIEITPSGSVQGDLSAPRVALADGSSFKGNIDMGRKQATTKAVKSGATQINTDVPLAARSSQV